MVKKRCFAGVFLIFLSFQIFTGEIFRFSHTAGDKYRILSEVEENVYINGFYSHSAEIMNRISMEITEGEGGAGKISGKFMTSERVYGSGQAYSWGREYPSEFQRDERGYYKISDGYYMPVVRDVPVFPEGEIEPGDIWSFPAREVHDLRENFGLPEPFIIPLDVDYKYLGTEETDGKVYHVIAVEYTIFLKFH